MSDAHIQSGPDISMYGAKEGRRTYNYRQEVQDPLHEAGDPRDGGRGVLAERIVHIVRLEDADAVAQSEGAEEDAPRPEQDSPGLAAALRESLRVDIDLLRGGHMLLDC